MWIKIAACGLILLLLSAPAALALLSVSLSDNVVNPDQDVLVSGTVDQGGLVDNALVDIRLDQATVPFEWSLSSDADWGSCQLENLAVSGGSVGLSYRADYDIAFVRGGWLHVVDIDGNVENLGVRARMVGDMKDVNGDGRPDIVYLNENGLVSFIDNTRNPWTISVYDEYGRDMRIVDLGGIADLDGNGTLEVLLVGCYVGYADSDLRLRRVNVTGGNSSVLNSSQTEFVGFPGFFSYSGYSLYIPYSLPAVPGLGWISLSGTGGWTATNGRPDTGPIADVDGDGDNEIVFVDSSGLRYLENTGTKTTISTALKVGQAIDLDLDGDLDIAIIDSDGYLKYVDGQGHVVSLGVIGENVGGIGDFDNDTGYRPSGRLVAVKDWRTPYFRLENIQVDVTIPAGTSISLMVEVSDNENFEVIKDNRTFVLSSGISTFTLGTERARYSRLTFSFTTTSKGTTPLLNSLNLRARVYTISGQFKCHIEAPSQLGTHEVSASSGGEENRAYMDVRRLVFDNFRLLDNHGQLDNILNPGEDYRLTVRIREDNGSTLYNVASGSFSLRIGSNTYPLEYWENSIWRTQASFTAPTTLGSYTLQVDNIWGNSGENILGSTSATYTYQVKRIRVPISFQPDDWYNPGENVTITGQLVVEPDGTPVRNVAVKVYQAGNYLGENLSNENGVYSFTWQAPLELGSYSVRATCTENGLEGDNTATYYVKTLTLTISLDDNTVQPGQWVTASGRATLWPEGMGVSNQVVVLYLGIKDNYENTKQYENENLTDASGNYSITFQAPSYTGEFEVHVHMRTFPQGIENDNYCYMRSEALRISLLLSDLDARPGELLQAQGKAYFDPSLAPAAYHTVTIWKWEGAAAESVQTDENGNWSYNFYAPSSWGVYHFRVHVENSGLVGENVMRYEVNQILVQLTFEDNTPGDASEKVVNPGENMRCLGRATLMPDNIPVDAGSVAYTLSWRGATDYTATDNQGRFVISWSDTPTSLGTYSVQVTVRKTYDDDEFNGSATDTIEVRTLSLSLLLSSTKVDGGATVHVSGSARTLTSSSSWPVVNRKVTVYVDGGEAGSDYTDSSGAYATDIIAPTTAGRHEVRAVCLDENGIRGENLENLWVERILISIGISDTVVNPSQAGLVVSGTARYEYSGDPVENTVFLYLDGSLLGQQQTSTTGGYSFTLDAPTSLGTHTLTVKIWDDVFYRDNSLNFWVRTLSIDLSLSDTIVMRGENIEVNGRVTVQPEGWPVPQNTLVKLYSWENTKNLYTDQDGRFSTVLTAPDVLGSKTVKAACEDENGITGEKSVLVSVRDLIYQGLQIQDSHGQTDAILNPGENYRILIRIRETDGTSYWDVSSAQSGNDFRVSVGGTEYFLVYTGSNGVWRSPTLTAESTPARYTHSLTFTGASANGIAGTASMDAQYTVKLVSLQLTFDNVVNPGESQNIRGKAVLLPDNQLQISKQISVTLPDNSTTTVQTDDQGCFALSFTAPSELGPADLTFSATADGGIESENSIRIWVKSISLDIKLDKTAVSEYDNLTLTGTATLLPEGRALGGLRVRIYGGGIDNENWVETWEDGSFTLTFPVSENAKRTAVGEVRVWTQDNNGIIGQNSVNYYVGQPVKVAGVLMNAENVPLPYVLRFISLTTAGCVIDVRADAKGAYSGVIIKGVYNLKIIMPNVEIVLKSVKTFENPPDWALFENLILLDNFPPTAANIPDVRAKLIAFAMEVSENLKGRFDGVRVTFNYSSLLGQISSEDKLVVFRSGNWDFTGRTGSFTGVGGLIDKVRHTVTLEYQELSAYVLAETTYSFEQLANNLQSAASSVSSAAGSLQGAAGRMEAAVVRFENVVAQMGALGEMLIPDPASLFLEVQQGENVSMRISLRNRSPVDMKVLPRLSGEVVEIVSVLENEIPIRALESAGLNLLIAVPSDQPVGNVNGSVVLHALVGKNLLTLREIPINLKVVPAEKSLVDLRVSSVQPTVRPGSVAAVSVNLLNIGKLPVVDARLLIRIVGPDGKVVLTRIENLSFETAFSKIYEFKLPSDLPEADYRVEAEAEYRANGRTYSTSSVTGFELRAEAPKEISVGGMSMASIFATLATGALAAGAGILAYRWERSRMKAKKRFEHLVAFAELPGMENAAWMGVLAETKRRAFFKFDDLMTHMIIAGATGSGKTIAGMVLAEEALLNKKNVIVIDPTAQWTGFLRKCEEEKMLRHFSKFGLSPDQAHGFPGRIIMVEDPNMRVDMGRMIRNPAGKIYIFVVEKLKPEQLDIFVQNLIQSVFDARLEESPHLKALIIFDEVHRLLPRFGGAGRGIVQLERGVREFRKWGVGIVLISQVISDFEKEIRANIRNQIQLWTRDEDELARITEKFGAEYMRSISRASVGHGMYFNPDYNKGKPYFINFRPILHQVGRMTPEELDKYTSASARVDAVRQKIEALEKVGVDTFDLRTELELTERKLEEGAFDMVDFYLESLEPNVDRLLEKHGLKGVVAPKAEEKPEEKAPEVEKAPVIEAYKEALAPVLKGGRTRRKSRKARR